MKKIISVLLSIIIVFSSAAVITQAENETEKYSQYPAVVVRGMQFEGLTVNEGTENGQNAFAGVTAGGIIKTIGKTLAGSFKHGLSRAFADAAAEYCGQIMGKMACDENGDSKYDVTVKQYFGSVAEEPELQKLLEVSDSHEEAIVSALVDSYGAENVYYFTYDWRLDPRKTADELNKMIELAESETGKDKVNLINCSMGGVVTDAYIYKYGDSDFNKLVFYSSTFCGTDEATQLLAGELLTSPDTLYNILVRLFGNNFFTKLFKNSLLLKNISKITNSFFQKEGVYFYSVFLKDTFGTMPSIWANVQPGSVETCIDFLFPTEEDREKYSGIIEKARQLRKINIYMKNTGFKKLESDNVQVAVVAGYNTSAVPVYPKAAYQSDGILDSRWMLGGATVSKLGYSFDDDYMSADPSKISPDRCIDLSDVYFPESTWAIRDSGHVPCKKNSDEYEFIKFLMTGENGATVDDDSRFPQFMTADKEGNLNAQ